MSGLAKEIWAKEFIKDFYPDSTFLKRAEDESKNVDNDKLNLAESGADPEVMWDNTVFPIPVAEQDDVPHEVLLRRVNTENTVIRDFKKAARNQDLRANAMKAHKRNLRLSTMKMAAHSYAPSTTSGALGNEIIPTTGTARASDGLKAATFEDLLTMGEVWDGFDIPAEERNIVLDIKHMQDLKRLNLKDYKDLLRDVNEGKFSALLGAYVHKYSQNPYYNTVDDTKLAFGGAPTATHTKVSFGFIGSETLWAFGKVKPFVNLDDAKEEGDVFHFATRFISIPKRNRFRLALISK